MLSYEIDWAYNLVDFTLEDDTGKHHVAVGFDEAIDLCKELLGEIDKSEENEAKADLEGKYGP